MKMLLFLKLLLRCLLNKIDLNDLLVYMFSLHHIPFL